MPAKIARMARSHRLLPWLPFSLDHKLAVRKAEIALVACRNIVWERAGAPSAHR
jgi:hypothetical protein